jgi:hypothetical protein
MDLPRHLERRNSARFRTNLPATVVIADGRVRLSACMRNLSDTGAKVRLAGAAEISGEFYMLIPDHRLQPCRLVWRTGDEMGLAFLD